MVRESLLETLPGWVWPEGLLSTLSDWRGSTAVFTQRCSHLHCRTQDVHVCCFHSLRWMVLDTHTHTHTHSHTPRDTHFYIYTLTHS